MDKTYIVIPKNCTGCRTCELACSMVKGEHGTLGHSRMTIYSNGPDAYMQMTCLQCVSAACATVWPTDALRRNDKTGAIDHVADRCSA